MHLMVHCSLFGVTKFGVTKFPKLSLVSTVNLPKSSKPAFFSSYFTVFIEVFPSLEPMITYETVQINKLGETKINALIVENYD